MARNAPTSASIRSRHRAMREVLRAGRQQGWRRTQRRQGSESVSRTEDRKIEGSSERGCKARQESLRRRIRSIATLVEGLHPPNAPKIRSPEIRESREVLARGIRSQVEALTGTTRLTRRANGRSGAGSE